MFARVVLIAFAVAPASLSAADDAWIQAIAKQDAQAVKRLIGEGADVNRANGDGQTALMLAASERDQALMQLLVERGAKVNAINSRGGTALMYSTNRGDLEAVKFLLAHDAAVNARASNGWTALMVAAARGFDPIAGVLLAGGADPNINDVYGWTPLMRAVERSRPKVVRVLLDTKRADVNKRDENGHTALHHAAALGSVEMVQWLIEAGANVQAKDNAGRVPADLARAQGHQAAGDILARAASRR